MLKMLSKEEVPAYGGKKRPTRVFAEKTLREFMQCSKVGDVAEVLDAPKTNLGSNSSYADQVHEADKVMSAIREELFYLSLRDKIKAFRRRERIFLERVQGKKEQSK